LNENNKKIHENINFERNWERVIKEWELEKKMDKKLKIFKKNNKTQKTINSKEKTNILAKLKIKCFKLIIFNSLSINFFIIGEKL
jgi:hypothetical protein